MNTATLRQLEYFVAAADTGTVSAAALRCSASQAAVSTALNELERGLGIQLFVRRTAKGVRLTKSGERALPIARRMLSDARELELLAAAEASEAAGPLRVACTSALSPRVLPALAEAFRAEHPLVDLDLVDGLASDVERMVLRGEADACLLYRRQLESDLDSRTVREVVPYAVLAADHPLAGRDRVALQDLASEPLLLVNPEGSRGVIERLLEEADVSPKRGWAFSNPETVRAMVARGLGYSVFSGRPISLESFDGGRVAYVPLADPIAPNEVVLATPKGQRMTARLQALQDLLMKDSVLEALG
ncbi:LysR family transcriptional regulator [Leucobacter tenebrionis]|uniref:LysR family transcriptional regulator n=1 Tax=Leucobacter tenebrionis TaxID=2873270 RepID=UPI001CA77B2B|nr:LysR family transcriptional regulator [Leucobacter tenebrionis]QZY50996.1 LysR family transcriptional regulator [Leucobacter tenebrionis]